ncbi:response regulator [Oribacterium sp. FC2011]|uniref:response regulator n=1 Tax=Oribacterium sp. FC2011 TaxID=1408311 RepID=UPI0006797E29|nr:response regulator [Oribacterium sp. FC2011]
MKTLFAETLRKLRTERGISQNQLGKQLHIYRSTIARWENGSRLPDATMILRLAECLGVDVSSLLNLVVDEDEFPNVMMVDDNELILSDGVAVLEEVMPDATVKGFIWPQEAVEYAKTNRVALAVLDIELGSASGLELCHTLLDINPRTNILFLTAFPDYALDAWKTEAIGFMLKPITPEDVREQLKKLRFPLCVGGVNR